MEKKKKIFLIVGIILVVVILAIIGIIILRNIMCSGYSLDPKLDPNTVRELQKIFGDKYGVNCMGTGSQEVRFEAGGRRQISCMIKTNQTINYEIKLDVESLTGASNEEVQKWILDEGWKGYVEPGDEKEAPVLILDIPKNAPATTLKLRITKTSSDGEIKTDYSVIDIIPLKPFWSKIFGGLCPTKFFSFVYYCVNP